MTETTAARWCGVSTEHEPHDRADGTPPCPGHGHLGAVGRELFSVQRELTRVRAAIEQLHHQYGDSPHCATDGYAWPCPTIDALYRTVVNLAAAGKDTPAGDESTRIAYPYKGSDGMTLLGPGGGLVTADGAAIWWKGEYYRRVDTPAGDRYDVNGAPMS